MKTLLIATRNAHKVAEIRAILGGQFNYLTLDNFPGAPAIAETAATFVGNATLKVLGLTRWLRGSGATVPSQKLFVLADDSGLEVEALGGAPGVHSARFAAMDSGDSGNSSDAENNAKLLRLLKDIPAQNWIARFRCVLVLQEIDISNKLTTLKSFSGVCEGRISSSPNGTGGFGYDPLFIPDGFKESFAELGSDVKNRLSHRAKALEKLKTEINKETKKP